MLSYNEIKVRKYIVLDDEPYEVLESHVARKSQGKPSNQTKLRQLKTGKVVAHTFHVSESVSEADIQNREIKYLYQKGVEIWFCNPSDPSDRFTISLDIIQNELKFMKQNDVIKGIYFENNDEDQLLGVKIPLKVSLVVKESPPAVKGNTSSGATKKVVLENGLEVHVPLFIGEGEKIFVNTDSGEYVERDNS